MGKANDQKIIRDKLQGINITADPETMRTNMSPFTDLDMHDQFAKPQSNGAFLLKNELFHRTQHSCIQRSSAAIM